MKNVALVVLVGLVWTAVLVGAYDYGTEINQWHYPDWRERCVHVLSNAARVDPVGYKNRYMLPYTQSAAQLANVFINNNYPAVDPLYFEPKLQNSAHDHSVDMGQRNYFGHNSGPNANDQSFTDRLRSYVTCQMAWSENIAAGTNLDNPLAALNLLICDADSSGNCAADKSGADGHRSDLMNGNLKATGVGYFYTNNYYRNYWTQDFTDRPCTVPIETPLFAGSHVILGNRVRFLVSVHVGDSDVRGDSYVWVNGNNGDYKLTRDLGNSRVGIYSFEMDKTNKCRSYAFQVYFTNGGSYRYPKNGCLVTVGDGNCNTAWNQGCPIGEVTGSTINGTSEASGEQGADGQFYPEPTSVGSVNATEGNAPLVTPASGSQKSGASTAGTGFLLISFAFAFTLALLF